MHVHMHAYLLDSSLRYTSHSADALASGLPALLHGSTACCPPAGDTASGMPRVADVAIAAISWLVEQWW